MTGDFNSGEVIYITLMVVRNYRKVLEEASQLTEMEQARLVKELARRLIQSHNLLDLSQVKDAALYVEYLRKAESKHPSGHLKTPEEFLRELESWEG